MRIISDFKDYYDNISSRDSKDPVYMRKTSEEDTGLPADILLNLQLRHCQVSEYAFIFGYCGQIVPLVNLRYSTGIKPGENLQEHNFFCKSIADMEAVFKKYADDTGENPWRGSWGHRKSWPLDSKQGFDTFFREKFRSLEKYFNFATPIWAAREKSHYMRQGYKHTILVTRNPQLKRNGFLSAYPPFTVFQDIESYLNGQARPEKPIPVLDDKTMCEIKGFDPRTSFRKRPTKNRRK